MFSSRLRQAIDRSGLSIRETAARMKAADAPGASEGNLRRILRGDADKLPPADFIEAAAETLGVRRAWLAWGEGAPTESEEAARTTSAMVKDKFDEAARMMREGVLTGLGIPTMEEAQQGEPSGTNLFATYHRGSGLRSWVVPAIELARRTGLTAEELGEALRAPLEAVGKNHGPRLAVHFAPAELDAYLLAMVADLLGLALPSDHPVQFHNAPGQPEKPARRPRSKDWPDTSLVKPPEFREARGTPAQKPADTDGS